MPPLKSKQRRFAWLIIMFSCCIDQLLNELSNYFEFERTFEVSFLFIIYGVVFLKRFIYIVYFSQFLICKCLLLGLMYIEKTTLDP